MAINNSIKKSMTRWVTTLPEFIDTRSSNHHYAFDCMQESFVLISKLIKRKIADKYVIWNMVVDINSHLDTIAITGEPDLVVQCRNYILQTIQTFEGICVAEEEFEAAENLKQLYHSIQYTKIKKAK